MVNFTTSFYRKHDRQLKFAPLEILADDTTDISSGFIAGWASTPSLDSYKDVVAVGAFSDSIAKRGLTGPSAVKLLLDHKASVQTVAGSISKLEYRNGAPGGATGLWLEAQLNLANESVRQAYDAAKSVGGLNFSVGFSTKTWSYDEEANVLTVLTGDLREVSLVVFPANEDCGMLVIKSENGNEPLARNPDVAQPVSLAEFEKMLVSAGIVDTRNKAHRITLEVKAHSYLFSTKAVEAPVVEPVVETVPLLPEVIVPDYAAASLKLDNVATLLKRLG